MATSGSFTLVTNTYAKWTFSWSRTSYTEGSSPTSTISWTLKVENALNPPISLTIPYTITVDGATTSGTASLNKNLSPTGGTSGTKTINHNSDGTKSFIVTFKPGSTTKTETYVLDILAVPATLTAAPNFNDEENPTIEFSCPTPGLVTMDACIEWYGGANTVSYRDIAPEDGSYTFNLTDAERKKLRQGITSGNTQSIRFTIRTWIGSTYYSSTLIRTLELINHEPTLSPGYYDQNQAVINLTGNSSVLVRYHSNVWVDAGANARKEAALVSTKITCGEKYLDQSSGLIEGVTSDKIYFSVTDSRGFTAEEVLEPTFIPYVRLTASTSITSFTLAGNLTFVIEGNYYNGSFGARDNYLQIGYKLKRNGQYLQEVSLDQTDGTLTFPRSGKYRYEFTIPNLAATDSSGSYYTYSIQTTIRDQLSRTITSQELSASAEPLFSWSKSDFKFTVPVHFERGFTDSTGLKTAVYNVNVNLNKAGSHPLCDLIDLGIDTNYQIIYSMNGTIAYWDDNLEIGKIYAVPSPALSNGTGSYSIVDATKFFVEDDVLYLTVGAAWGYVYVRLVIQYF